MVIGSSEAMKVFICYAPEDELLLNILRKHLLELGRQGIIEIWHNRDIGAGSTWEEEIKRQLDAADIILLLVSPDFMASDYCYDKEMPYAMWRHERGEAYVIPVILRPVYWQGTLFSRLRMLPNDAKPIVGGSWHDEDEAFLNVTESILETISQVQPFRKKSVYREGEELVQIDSKEENEDVNEQGTNKIPPSFDQPSHADHTSTHITFKGRFLNTSGSRKDKFNTHKQKIHSDPKNSPKYVAKGNILAERKQYAEALAAYELALRAALEPGTFWNFQAWEGKSYVLQQLGKPAEALRARQAAERSRAIWMERGTLHLL